MLPNYLASIKSSGIYRFVFDKSEMPAPEAEILRLVVGYSEKGPFNTPVYVTNEDEFKKIFGGRSKKLERYGMWFHRLAIQALKAGPILALNLKNFENPFNEGTPGYENWGKYNRVDFTTFNPNESIFNIGELAEIEDNLQMAIKDIYNTDRFWTLEPEQLEEYVNNHDEDAGGHDFEAGYITIATTDSKESSATVFMRGYTPKGYDVPFMEWYSAVLNGAELPTYLEGHERDLVSQYFAEVYIFKGEFTPEIASSDKLAKFFNVDGETVTLKPYILNAFGEKVDTLDALASNDASNFINKYQGILLPDFRNANNTVISLDALVNGDNYIHKLMMRFNQDMLYSIEPDGDFQLSDLDTTGWNLGPFVGERFSGTPYRMMSFTDLDPVVYTGVGYSVENGWIWRPRFEDQQGLPADYYDISLESDSEAVTIDGNSLQFSVIEGDLYSEELISALNALNIQVGEPIIFMYPEENPITPENENEFTQPLHVTQINQTEDDTTVYKVNGEGKSYKFRPTSERRTSSDAYGKYKVRRNNTGAGEVECDLSPYWDDTNEMLWLMAKITNSSSQPLPMGSVFFILFDNIYSAKTPGDTSTFEIYDDQFTQIQDIDLTTLEFSLPNTAVKVRYTITGETDPRACDLVLMDIPDDRERRIKFQVFDCDYEIEEGHDPYEMFQNGDTIYFSEMDEYNNSNYKLFFGDSQIPDKIDGAIRYGSGAFHPDLNIFGGFEGASMSFLIDWYIVEFDASEGAPLYYAAQPTIDQVQATVRTIEWVFDNELPEHIIGMFRCVGSVTSNTSANLRPLYLHGYTFGNPKPETTKQYDKLQWQHYMLDALKNYRGLRIALTSRVDLEYRYLVDTFEGFVEAECKAMLSTICKEKDNAFAILNFPAIKTFSKSHQQGGPSFRNEKGEFDTKYIAMGGNPLKSMPMMFTLPSQENGASWCGFFTALKIRDINTGVKEDIPSAALVSNNFMTKYSTYYPYTIIAGTNRGIIREQGLIGPDFNFCREDLDNLEPFGVNCMVYVDRKGTCINSNQTAKQNPVTTLSKINVRELVIFLQDEIEKLLLDYHWDFNTPNLRQRIEDRANVILETAKNNGGVFKYLNQCSDDNNTDDVINSEMLVLDTSIEPGMGAGKMVQRLYIFRKGGMSSAISEA